jgi:2-keto-3-deoxy-L-rhamnonate aldolase RhmA
MHKTFRKNLKAKKLLFGTMVTLPTASTAEILASLGFDWLFVDGEHGPLEAAEMLSILQTVGDKAACLVRVPYADEVHIKKVLDLGAAGIIAPQVNTALHAANVVKWSRYSPLGSRGVGLARAHGYGMSFQEYVQTANDQIAVVVQAEHKDAVENIEAIVKVEGVDAVLLGPYDLSASLGKMGQIDAPEVVEAIEHITQTCLKANMPLGYFGVNAEAVKPFIAKGYTLIVSGVDTMLLGTAAKRLLEKLRGESL